MVYIIRTSMKSPTLLPYQYALYLVTHIETLVDTMSVSGTSHSYVNLYPSNVVAAALEEL